MYTVHIIARSCATYTTVQKYNNSGQWKKLFSWRKTIPFIVPRDGWSNFQISTRWTYSNLCTVDAIHELAKIWSNLKLGHESTVFINLHGSVHHWYHRHHRHLASQLVSILKYSSCYEADTHVKVMKSQKHHVVHAPKWMYFRNCCSLTHCEWMCMFHHSEIPSCGKSGKKHTMPKLVSGSLETTKQRYSTWVLSPIVHTHSHNFGQCCCCVLVFKPTE